MTDKPSTSDKMRDPLDTSTVLALGVWLLVLVALIVSVAVGDKELTRDLAKNFVGPGFLIILGYYFGSTSASKRKDETIANMSEAAK